MKVREVMTELAATAPPSVSLEELAMRMRDLGVGFLPICDGDRIVGTVTDRDIVVRAVANGASAVRCAAEDVMTPVVVTCHHDDPVEEAARLMSAHQVRRLIVLDRDDRVVGVVSLGDLATRMRDEHVPAKTLEAVSRDRPARV